MSCKSIGLEKKDGLEREKGENEHGKHILDENVLKKGK